MATQEGSRPIPDAESPQAAAGARRRGVRLWVVMALVAFAAFVMARTITRARAQREAVAVIKAAGGNVGYDYEYRTEFLLRLLWSKVEGAKPWGPDWLRKAFGEDYFRRVVFVSFDRQRPEHLAPIVRQLERLEDLRFLYLEDLNDRELGLLEGLDQVQGMYLSSYEITDTGLAEIARHARLRALVLDHTAITDAGLAHLGRLSNLETLELDQTAITDSGVAHLRGLTRLRHLDLAFTKVGDEGMASIGRLTRLKTLKLWRTRVGDVGLSYLAGLKQLDYLDLTETRVTDAGLVHLHGLPNLRAVALPLAETITPAGVAALNAGRRAPVAAPPLRAVRPRH